MQSTTKLDTQFLKPHPATEAWWGQRAQCEACSASYREVGIGGVRCRAFPQSKNQTPHGYCIDARLVDGPCGPNAILFIPKEKK